VADFTAQAAVKTADGQARSKKLNAEADAMVVKTVGEAEASKTRAIGIAEADVIKMKISSMEADKYAVVQVAQALAGAGIKLVPDISVGGGASGAGTGLVDVLLGNLLLKKKEKAGTREPLG